MVKRVGCPRGKIRVDGQCVSVYGKCRFSSKEEKARNVRKLLRVANDKLPQSEIRKATKPKIMGKWVVVCDRNNPKKAISGVRYEKTDWYLATIKNLGTDPDYRGLGLGTLVTERVMKRATRGPMGAKVLATDITDINRPSQRVVEKLGFKRVNKFCWKKGENPADILHYVYYPPIFGKICGEQTKKIKVRKS